MNQEESPTESSFSSSVIRIAVSQICQSVGFQSAQNSALNIITDIAARYLQSIAKSAASSANSFSRTESNVFDIIMALEDLGSGQGFKGGSEMNVECVTKSSLVVELERFLVFSDEAPFAKPLPRRKRINGDCVAKDDVVKPNHVPMWLPTMPAIVREEEEEEGEWEEWKCCNEEEREEDGFESSEKRGGGVKEVVGKGKSGSSVCKSGGFGKKRVLCKNVFKSGNGGGEKERVMVSFKKRQIMNLRFVM